MSSVAQGEGPAESCEAHEVRADAGQGGRERARLDAGPVGPANLICGQSTGPRTRLTRDSTMTQHDCICAHMRCCCGLWPWTLQNLHCRSGSRAVIYMCERSSRLTQPLHSRHEM